MSCDNGHCADCRDMIEGSRGALPHAGLVRWYSNGYASTYYCHHCGKVWEYHIAGFFQGWQQVVAA